MRPEARSRPAARSPDRQPAAGTRFGRAGSQCHHEACPRRTRPAPEAVGARCRQVRLHRRRATCRAGGRRRGRSAEGPFRHRRTGSQLQVRRHAQGAAQADPDGGSRRDDRARRPAARQGLPRFRRAGRRYRRGHAACRSRRSTHASVSASVTARQAAQPRTRSRASRTMRRSHMADRWRPSAMPIHPPRCGSRATARPRFRPDRRRQTAPASTESDEADAGVVAVAPAARSAARACGGSTRMHRPKWPRSTRQRQQRRLRPP